MKWDVNWESFFDLGVFVFAVEAIVLTKIEVIRGVLASISCQSSSHHHQHQFFLFFFFCFRFWTLFMAWFICCCWSVLLILGWFLESWIIVLNDFSLCSNRWWSRFSLFPWFSLMSTKYWPVAVVLFFFEFSSGLWIGFHFMLLGSFSLSSYYCSVQSLKKKFGWYCICGIIQ